MTKTTGKKKKVPKKKTVSKTKSGLPLSGSEYTYTTRGWSHPIVIGNNNCYAYAVNDMKLYRSQKAVPGNVSGLKAPPGFMYKTCGNLKERVVSDNPKKVYSQDAKKPCRRGFYKIMMFVAPKNNYGSSYGDFHFYKHHGRAEYRIKSGDTVSSVAKFFGVSPGKIKRAAGGDWKQGKRIYFNANFWSHKQGWATGPQLKDAKGKPIRDPRKADRNYAMKYKTYCGSFCVKNSGVKVGKRSTNVKKE